MKLNQYYRFGFTSSTRTNQQKPSQPIIKQNQTNTKNQQQKTKHDRHSPHMRYITQNLTKMHHTWDFLNGLIHAHVHSTINPIHA